MPTKIHCVLAFESYTFLKCPDFKMCLHKSNKCLWAALMHFNDACSGHRCSVIISMFNCQRDVSVVQGVMTAKFQIWTPKLQILAKTLLFMIEHCIYICRWLYYQKSRTSILLIENKFSADCGTRTNTVQCIHIPSSLASNSMRAGWTQSAWVWHWRGLLTNLPTPYQSQ